MRTAVEPLEFENHGRFSLVQFRAFLSSFFEYLQVQPLLNLHPSTLDLQIAPPFPLILVLSLTRSLYHGFGDCYFCIFLSMFFFFFWLFLHFSLSLCVLPLHSTIFWSLHMIHDRQLAFQSPTKYLLSTTFFLKCYWALFFI